MLPAKNLRLGAFYWYFWYNFDNLSCKREDSISPPWLVTSSSFSKTIYGTGIPWIWMLSGWPVMISSQSEDLYRDSIFVSDNPCSNMLSGLSGLKRARFLRSDSFQDTSRYRMAIRLAMVLLRCLNALWNPPCEVPLANSIMMVLLRQRRSKKRNAQATRRWKVKSLRS